MCSRNVRECSKYAGKCSKKQQNSRFLEHTSYTQIFALENLKKLLNNPLEKPGRLCYYIPCRRDVAQLGRALRSGRKGRRFESCHPDQIYALAVRVIGIFLTVVHLCNIHAKATAENQK